MNKFAGTLFFTVPDVPHSTDLGKRITLEN